tara:strand:- start:970 stop:1137 length:168 start_codon:yes stop_codon:yes gene_type:complete
MHEELLLTCALLVEHANVAELFEIDGCGLAFGNATLDEVLNAAIRLLENEFEEFV